MGRHDRRHGVARSELLPSSPADAGLFSILYTSVSANGFGLAAVGVQEANGSSPFPLVFTSAFEVEGAARRAGHDED